MTTLKHTVEYSDGVSKTDATGVVFYKNQLPITEDNKFPVLCGEGAWSCAGGVSIIGAGLLQFTQGNGVATQAGLPITSGDSYNFHIETQAAGGGATTLSFALGGGTPVVINPEVGFVYDIVLVAGAGTDLVVSGPDGVVEVTMVRGYEILYADNEISTGTVLSLGQPAANFIAFDTTWVTDPIAGGRVFYDYDGLGNLTSLNNGEPLGAESIEITNCLDVNLVGILSINSGDDSVVFESTLTSLASITDNNGVLQAGATVDSNGLLSGPAGGALFDLSTISVPDKALLDNAFQFSLDIKDTDWGTYVADFAKSVQRTTNGYFHQWRDAVGAGLPFGSAYINTTNAIIAYVQQENETALSNTNFRSHEVIGSENGFTTLTVSCDGLNTELYYNGVRANAETRTTITTGLFNLLMIGSLTNESSPLDGGLIKNVRLSKRPALFRPEARLVNLTWYGDSFVDRSGDSSAYGAGCINATEALFRRKNWEINAVEAGVGGATVSDLGSRTIGSQIDGTSPDKPNLGVADLNPYVVCYRGWTNDAQELAFDLNASHTDFQAQITTILAEAQFLVVGTVPSLDIRNGSTWSGDTTRIARIDTINGFINNIQATMTGINPAFAGRIFVVDEFTLLGGHNPQGTDIENFLPADFHPSGFGQWKQGELFANEVARILGL